MAVYGWRLKACFTRLKLSALACKRSKNSSMDIRQATISDLQTLSDLCIRSKASWGYDADFLRACEDELAFTSEDFELSIVLVAERDAQLCGVIQLSGVKSLPTDFVAAPGAVLLEVEKLLIEPGFFHKGIGRALFVFATTFAVQYGASDLFIVSDPYALPFYENMGADLRGYILSATWPDRWLPFLNYSLKQA